MKNAKKSLAIALTLLMLICVAAFSASAADKIQYDVNKIEVTTYRELKNALETKSEETNPKDIYVVLMNDITDEWDGYTDIQITYPGNVTLDMNGHSINMTSANGDAMFFLKGSNPTYFSIINTGATVNSIINFKSNVSSSSVIYSNNPNASLYLIGEYTKYDTQQTNNNAVWNYDLKLHTDYASDSSDNSTHYTLLLAKINTAYISGVELKNFTSKPTNLYVGEANNLLITGKSALTHRNSGISGTNVVLGSEYSNTYKLYGFLGSCYIQGDYGTLTNYQSISATRSGSTSFNYKWILLDNSGTPSGSSQMPNNVEVYNSEKISSSLATVDTYRDIFIRRSCCEGENPATTFTDVTPLGHLTRCNDCYSTRSYQLHDFKLKTRPTISTCNKNGKTAYYECGVANCNYCKGGESLPLNPNMHDPSNVIDRDDVPATCTETGLTGIKYCKACATTIAQTVTPVLDHSYSEWTTSKEATCTADGTEKRTCSGCGKVDTKTIAATGHSFGNWTTSKEATCTVNGTEKRTCSGCGKVETKTIKATGHSYSSWSTSKEATCTVNGTEKRTCSDCGKVDTKTIEATGHSFGSWTTTKKATCDVKGSQKRTCANCDEVETRSTNVLGHSYSSKWTTDKKATCTKAGSKSHHCTRCDAKKDVTTIKATGHKYKTTVTTKATTSKNGTKTTKCSVCGYSYKKTIAKISSVKLSATSYTYDGKVKKPTVTVKDSNGNKLKNGTDYTVKYSSGRKNVGKYTVTVTFKGSYSGTKKLTFKINPKGTSVSKLTAGKGKFTATWKKQSTQVSGYQIQYSTSSKMTNAKTKTYSGASKTSASVSGLKSAKTYYVRVRTYKNVTIDGKTVKLYSSWSSVKSVKTK